MKKTQKNFDYLKPGLLELAEILSKVFSDKDGCIQTKNKTFEEQFQTLSGELKELEEAIKKDDSGEINEELGHVLYDTISLAMMGEKQGKVSIEKMFKELNWSMKFRHPHVFEGAKAETIEEVKRLKKERKDAYHKMKIGLKKSDLPWEQ